MDLHGQIMNLPFKAPSDVAWTVAEMQAAKIGHRDARHAAAELASVQDAEIAKLRAYIRELEDSRSKDAEPLAALLERCRPFIEVEQTMESEHLLRDIANALEDGP